jgi:hypothetical protein
MTSANPMSVSKRIRAELTVLATRLSVPVDLAVTIFDELAALSLNGPFRSGSCRHSAINRDGVPFEWSVSAGLTPGGLRFLTEYGLQGSSTAIRTQQSLIVLLKLLGRLHFPARLIAEYEGILRRLFPADHLLDRSLMGMWIGVGLNNGGSAAFKAYINQEVYECATRYLRLATCLAHLKRFSALDKLKSFTRAVGQKAAPGGISVELTGGVIDRVKVYMRLHDASLSFLCAAAQALGCCDVRERLEVFYAIMNHGTHQGTEFDARAAVLSFECPTDDDEISFKLDVNCARQFTSDYAAHCCSQELLRQLKFDEREYQTLLETCVPHFSDDSVDRFTWIGTALRKREQRINIYLHPGTH